MKNGILIDLGILVIGCAAGVLTSGCTHNELEQYAGQLPQTLECGELNGARTQAAIMLAANDPKAFQEKIATDAKTDLKELACLLLDMAHQVKPGSEVYIMVHDALKALRLIE